MKRKSFMKRGICLAIAMAMLNMTACGAKVETGSEDTRYEDTVQQAENEVEQEDLTQVASADGDVIEMIKAKYQAAPADYSGNIIEVERDKNLEIQIGFNPWENNVSLYDEIKVYKDAEMTQPLSVFSYDYNEETGMLTIEAPFAGVGEITSGDEIDVSDLSGSYLMESEGSGWGNLSQYYMATGIDLETGKKLEKPEITVVKVKTEISKAPQMKFTQTENGEAKFYWQPVEGADEYLVFEIQDSGDDMGLQEFARVIGRTTDCEWVCESLVFDDASYLSEGEISGVMNEMFIHCFEYEGDDEETDFSEFESSTEYCYGVIAVNADGASPMSNIMYERDLCHMLPNSLQSASNFDFCNVDTTSELPATLNVTMCDGSTAQRLLEYDFDSLKKDDSFGGYEVNAKVDGTIYVETLTVYNPNWDTLEADIAAIEERQDKLKNKGGNVEPSQDMDDTKETPETETEPEVKETEVKETEEATETESEAKETEEATETESEAKETEEATETESEVKETEEATETESEAKETEEATETESEEKETESEAPAGDDSQVNKPSEIDLESNVTASSALSEYIARNLLVTNEAIDVSAFPEAVDWNVLEDAFCEAYYQNPLILGISRYGADLENGVFYVEYEDDAETVAAKQQEIIEKVNDVVAEIITDDMTDWEKGYAINQYLCENSEYDYEALESAEANNFEYVDEKYNDSFNAYGCLVNGVGVCASYSADYKLLADAAGLESIVVTGYLDGTYAHAWNKVNIDGNWYVVDSTNNDKDIVANALLNLSDSASDATLVEDGRFAIEETISSYAANSDDMEFYHVINRFFEQDEISGKLAAELKENKYSIFRTDYDLNDEEFETILNETANDAQVPIQGAYWMGIVVMAEYEN